MKFCNSLLLLSQLLSTRIKSAKGVVEISPPAVAPVCQAEDPLELTCTSTSAEMILRWEFTVFPENVTYTTSPVASVGRLPQPLTIGTSTMITFSRLSGQGSSPLVSRIVVNPVNRDINGTVVNCFEGISSTDSVATTTILIIDPGQFELSIRSDPEESLRDEVMIVLEWILLNSQLYYQQFLRNISVNTDPPLNNVMSAGNMRVQIVLSYNTQYNVSITQHSTCERLIRTTFLQLNYNKCRNPMELTNARAVGYEDPALKGQNITFTCAHGQVLNGSNSSTCMGNGQWEPDPGEVECIGPDTHAMTTTVGQSVTTGTTTLAKCSNPLYVLQISDSIMVIKESLVQKFDNTDTCCSSGFLVNSGANTTICLENGEWELETFQINHEEMSAMLRTALVSVTCVLVVMSVFTFIIGLFCGHYFSQKWRESADKNKQVANPKTDSESDLELKENVAYITVHPTT